MLNMLMRVQCCAFPLVNLWIHFSDLRTTFGTIEIYSAGFSYQVKGIILWHLWKRATLLYCGIIYCPSPLSAWEEKRVTTGRALMRLLLSRLIWGSEMDRWTNRSPAPLHPIPKNIKAAVSLHKTSSRQRCTVHYTKKVHSWLDYAICSSFCIFVFWIQNPRSYYGWLMINH